MSAAAVTSPAAFAFHAPLPLPPADTDGGDFAFHVPANAGAALTAADELFSGGKLVPLLSPPPPLPCSPPAPCVELHLQEEDEALSESEPASPRAPRCAGRRWRDLLLLVTTKKRPKPRDTTTKSRSETHYSRPLLSRDSSSSSSSTSSSSSLDDPARRRPPPPPLRTRSAPVASLLHLMSKKQTIGAGDAPMKRHQQGPPCAYAYPLLTRASSSSSSSASSSSDSGSRAPWHPRAPALARPRRPAVAAESPRVSASGRVVFRGLERSSSTPAAAGIGIGARRPRPRPRGMERSYSTNVRVDPVINVFGFGHLFFAASPAKEKKERDVAGGRKNRPEKLAMVLRDPHD